MKIRTLVVDDEPLARQRILQLLAQEPDIEIVGEAGDGPEAVGRIRQSAPDLLFLDVQMPGSSGFEVLQQVPESAWPVVIFTTAHDQHALQAFEVHALDYLLKPFKPARFKLAVQRAREQIANRHAGTATRGLLALLGQSPPAPATAPTPPAGRLARLAVKSPGRITFVELDQIQVIEAAGKFAVVQVGKENHVLRETMTALESGLPADRFLRINRSAIVSIDQIRELQPGFKGETLVILKNGKSYPTTRPLRELQQRLEFR